MKLRGAVALAFVVGLGCGHRFERSAARPSAAEARAYHYQDSSGLLVGTYGGWVYQRLPAGTSVEGKGLADYVHLDPSRGFDPTKAGANRQAPDAVTSASATAGGGKIADKWRVEGQLGLDLEREVRGVPVTVGAVGRASHEFDYRSLSGGLRGSVAPFERNTTLTALVAYGADRVVPVEVAHGQEALWPGHHDRWATSAGVSQLLGPTLVLNAGAAATFQRGALSSPYRRAVVAPNLLLPEALPHARDRYSAYVGLSWSVTPRLAVHVSQGAYVDSWQVAAVVPELRVAGEVDDGVLLTGGYRYYGQKAASFYRATYAEERPVMAGDLRLGAITDHTVSFDLRRRTRTSGTWDLPLLFGYTLSLLDYRGVGMHVVSHVFSVGMAADY